MRQNAFVGNAGLVVNRNGIADAYIPRSHALWLSPKVASYTDVNYRPIDGDLIMKDRYAKILLTIIAVNLTVITLDKAVDRFIPEAMAASSIQQVAICDWKHTDRCAPVTGTLGLVVFD